MKLFHKNNGQSVFFQERNTAISAIIIINRMPHVKIWIKIGPPYFKGFYILLHNISSLFILKLCVYINIYYFLLYIEAV